MKIEWYSFIPFLLGLANFYAPIRFRRQRHTGWWIVNLTISLLAMIVCFILGVMGLIALNK